MSETTGGGLSAEEYRRCQDAARKDAPGSAVHLFAEFEQILADRVAAAEQRAEQITAAPCPTCVMEGGPYRCCKCCADDPGAHGGGQRDHHDLPCSTCIRAALAPNQYDTANAAATAHVDQWREREAAKAEGFGEALRAVLDRADEGIEFGPENYSRLVGIVRDVDTRFARDRADALTAEGRTGDGA